MGVLKYLIAAAAAGLALWTGRLLIQEPQVPKLKEDEWWGKGPNSPDESECQLEEWLVVLLLVYLFLT